MKIIQFFCFDSFVILLIDNSSNYFVDWQTSKCFKILTTLYAFSWIGYKVALVSQKLSNPRGNVIFYEELFYICNLIMSAFFCVTCGGDCFFKLFMNGSEFKVRHE